MKEFHSFISYLADEMQFWILKFCALVSPQNKFKGDHSSYLLRQDAKVRARPRRFMNGEEIFTIC